MSHAATNWAITQRGLKPAARIVLWHLADCHNPRLGCFPSQEWLADACEMSRSTVNLHLEKLEASGLIRREAGRCPKTGKQFNTRYVLGFEIGDQAPENGLEAGSDAGQEPGNPCPETGHGDSLENGAGAVSENGENPCPKNGDIRVRNSDTNPVREPVKEPVSERERSRAETDGVEGKGKPDPKTVPETADFQKRVMRFCNGTGFAAGPWPDWDTSSPGWIARQFARLGENDRQHAERWRDAYLRDLATRKRKPVPVGVFLKDRLWEGLDPDLLLKASRAAAQGAKPAEHALPDGWAKAKGLVWAAALFDVLLSGPDHPEHAPEGGLWLAGVERRAWPRFVWLKQNADMGRGFVAPERLHRLKGSMEFVPVDTDVWRAWETEFRARSWPDWPRHDGMKGMYFPAGGPDGLAAFEQALADHGSGKRTLSESEAQALSAKQEEAAE